MLLQMEVQKKSKNQKELLDPVIAVVWHRTWMVRPFLKSPIRFFLNLLTMALLMKVAIQSVMGTILRKQLQTIQTKPFKEASDGGLTLSIKNSWQTKNIASPSVWTLVRLLLGAFRFRGHIIVRCFVKEISCRVEK